MQFVFINLGMIVGLFSITDKHGLFGTPRESTTATTKASGSTYALRKLLPAFFNILSNSF